MDIVVKNVNIAVLDTGVFKHKQLDGCIKHFMDFCGWKGDML